MPDLTGTPEPITTIDLIPGDEYRRKTYGILMVSATQHDFAGRGIHNPHHRHSLEVWEHRLSRTTLHAGKIVDPMGALTDEPYSYRWNPHANVISAHPSMRDNPTMGQTLRLGDVVRLAVNGLVLGDFRIEAKPAHNPHLVRL